MAKITTKAILIIIVAFLLSFAILAQTTKGIGFLENIELPGFGARKAQVYVFKIAPIVPAPSPRYVYKINLPAQPKDQRKKQVSNEIDKIKKSLRQERQTSKTCKEKIIKLKNSLISKAQKETKANDFDFYMGIGSYGPNTYDLAGEFIWGKIKYRPFHFYDDKLELGLFGFGALGIGSSKNSRHTAAKFVVGSTLKMNFSDWTADLDFGIGKLSNKIDTGSYETKQIDDLFVLSGFFNFYSRRDKKKKWLPETSFGFEANLPYSTNCKGCLREYNNKVIGVWFRQAIYDFEPTQNLLLTPKLNIGLRREYEEKSNSLRIGPFLTMSYYGQNILSLSFLNYERNLKGGKSDIQWLSGWLSIGGIIKSIKASRIKEARPEDLAKRLAGK